MLSYYQHRAIAHILRSKTFKVSTGESLVYIVFWQKQKQSNKKPSWAEEKT
jgi:hypothetical protein